MASKTGRPTKFKKEYCDMLVKHMRSGLSFESFAAEIGTHRDTLYHWANTIPIFSDAKKRGMDLCQAYFEKMGNAAMTGQVHVDQKTGKAIDFKNFNGAIWIFSMKARFGWRDRTSIELEGNPDKPIEVHNRTDAEIVERINALNEKLSKLPK